MPPLAEPPTQPVPLASPSTADAPPTWEPPTLIEPPPPDFAPPKAMAQPVPEDHEVIQTLVVTRQKAFDRPCQGRRRAFESLLPLQEHSMKDAVSSEAQLRLEHHLELQFSMERVDVRATSGLGDTMGTPISEAVRAQARQPLAKRTPSTGWR